MKLYRYRFYKSMDGRMAFLSLRGRGNDKNRVFQRLLKVDKESGLQLLLNNTAKVLDKTFIECSSCIDKIEMLKQVQHDSYDVQDDDVNIKKYEAGYLEAEVNALESRWVVFNENNI